MKTLEDLKKLFPIIVEEIRDRDHEVGESYADQDEDGWYTCNEYASNYYAYEKDGWLIEVSYKCAGDWDNDPGDYWTPPSSSLDRAWGEVTEITASHYDEDTDEESEFSEDDLSELWDAIDEALKDIA